MTRFVRSAPVRVSVSVLGVLSTLTLVAPLLHSAAASAASLRPDTRALVRAAAAAQHAPTTVAAIAPPPGGFPRGVRVTAQLSTLSDAYSDTYQLASGQRLVMNYESPINYQDAAGRWQAINPDLVASTDAGYAWQNAAGPTLSTDGRHWNLERSLHQLPGDLVAYWSGTPPYVAFGR